MGAGRAARGRPRGGRRPTSPSLALRHDFATISPQHAARSPDGPNPDLDSASESRETVFERSHAVAATNINRVVLTGNLTRDPELRSLPSGMSVCCCAIASNTRRKDGHGRVGGQAELLRRDRLGRPGRELRALPRQGPPGRARRPPRVARVAGPGRRQAPERSRSSPTPSSSWAAATRARAAAATASRRSPTSRSTTATSSPWPRPPAPARRRTTTSPSRQPRPHAGPAPSTLRPAAAPRTRLPQ